VQYYILTQNSRLSEVFDWLRAHSIPLDIHLNRTRFTIEEDSVVYTEFCLRFADCCYPVDPYLDLATGLPLLDSEC
jgi:hypothetical protein